MTQNPLLEKYPEIVELLRDRSLSYPIDTKEQFVEQMAQESPYVVFRGTAYDTRFGASLLPDFFFPLASEDDLVTKVVELLVSRGLVAVG